MSFVKTFLIVFGAAVATVLAMPPPEMPMDIESRCRRPETRGGCMVMVDVHVLNPMSGQCEAKTIGSGCTTNGFRKLEDCKQQCELPMDTVTRCQQPTTTGMCDMIIQTHVFNPVSGACEPKMIGSGCTTNGFTQIEECQANCIPKPQLPTDLESRCKRPQTMGMCQMIIEAHVFNPVSGKCEKRPIGSGCSTNGFTELNECQTNCMEQERVSHNLPMDVISRCQSPQTVGMCQMIIEAHVFNPSNGMCEKKQIGSGCVTNGFQQLEDCQANCRPAPVLPTDIESRCKRPQAIGMCQMIIEVHVFNPISSQCEKRVVGSGCSTNGFKELEDCQANCMSRFD